VHTYCATWTLVLLSLPLALAAREPTFERQWGSQGTGNGQFEVIHGVHLGPGGVVWVADLHAVQSFDTQGSFRARWDFTNTGWVTGPSDVTVAANGDVFVTDRFNDSLTRASESGESLDVFHSFCPDVHLCPVSLRTIAIDSRGFLFVGVYRLGQVWLLDPSLQPVSVWDGFGHPDGIAIDALDQVFVVDSQRHQVRKLDSAGNALLSWGEYGDQPGQFKAPCGIAIDPQGIVYVADRDNHRIQAFDPLGVHLFSWGSLGSGPGEFMNPSAIDVGADGAIYVGDTGNHRIQKFTPPVAVSSQTWSAVKSRFR
jgi:streptogramin lyase